MLSIGQPSTITIRPLQRPTKQSTGRLKISPVFQRSLPGTKLDLKKASASDTFALDVVDWATINNNDKAATKAYKAINWETQDFTSVPKELAWDKINLKKASASDTFALDVVDWTTINNNDKAATKAYKAINWETQDFTSVPKELAWDKINSRFQESLLHPTRLP